MSLSTVDRAATHIFDLIDAGKIGLAESILEATLAKFPENHALLAAEALILTSGKQMEKAREKAEALSQQKLTDERAISAILHVLQQCCSWSALAKTYESIIDAQNERSILENLVQTYVRMGSYDMVHKTAVQLHRKWREPRYQVWIVQANLSRVPLDTTDDVLLKVSTRLLDSVILTEGGLISPSTSQMYVELLHQQRLYKEAVLYLCSDRGAAVGLLETRLELLATSLRLDGDLAKTNAVAKYLWNRQPDNWTFVQLYLSSLSEGNTGSGVLELDGPEEAKRAVIELTDTDCTLEDALCFCHKLMAAAEGSERGRTCRGPFMAEMEILSRQGAASLLQQATLAYAKYFYRAACCFLDVSTFLDESSAAAIYAWSLEDLKDGSTEKPLDRHARRILGMRAHVALWGTEKEKQPDHTEVRKLLQECRTAYEEAKPLSAQLAWSEEGLCDGYITVCLNVALLVYHASRDMKWVEEGLSLLDTVDRKLNNPAWLVYAVCFARILGLTDVEAWRQLSFKSVQHDTMSHIGYWPLFTGSAVGEMCDWNTMAWEHYRSLQRDCSLIRSKVFTLMSWPGINDVHEFERRQMHSIARLICSVHRIATGLRRCQTQRNIFDLMEAEEHTMEEAFDALQTPKVEELTDNTDWVVVRSMVLGNIHGERVEALTDTLVGMPTKSWRIEHTRQLLGSLMILHDIALLESHRMQVANAPKPKKSKGAAAKVTIPIPSLPTLLCEGRASLLQTLPVVRSIAPELLESVSSRGGGAPLPHSTAFHDSLMLAMSPEEVLRFLFPEGLILTALLQVGGTSKLPIVAWANDLQKALQRLQNMSLGTEDTISGDHLKELRRAKALRIRELSSDLLRDALAAGRRR